jgi:alpha-L-fucosidase
MSSFELSEEFELIQMICRNKLVKHDSYKLKLYHMNTIKKMYLFSLMAAIIIVACGPTEKKEEKRYEPNWESLQEHNEGPEWFQDAKFGIYFHWGVYSVPAFGNEWYPYKMHFKDKKEYQHHLEKYGHPSEFGYHDFVPMFKAEHFNAEKWAGLFEKAGARFAGPVAEHHDGFSMWDSDVTPWNAKDKGPKQDITGELAKELEKRNMKLITTFHHARNLQRYKDKPEEEKFRNSHYPYIEGMPPVSEDDTLKYLYGNIPGKKWLEEVWLGKLKEVINKYQPDIIWFDSWLDKIPENYRQEFCAYYLNEAEKWEKDVVIVRKQKDLPLDVSVDDMEKSRKNKIEEKVWMTDETISKGSWCYTENLEIKETKDVLHVLIDIVSKNGVLLLNVSPKANGIIPDNQQKVLLEIGEWLDNYGEAIYKTRPWYTHGEGPTKEPEGGFSIHKEFLKIKYSEKDIRYTTKGKTIYATVLGKPAPESTLTMHAFATDSLPAPPDIQSVALMGSDDDIDWELTESGLDISIPDAEMDPMAVVFEIKTK